MIRLTRLNKQPFVLNAELMQMIEEAPDTIITLVNNEKFLVLESAEEVIQRIIDYHRSIRLFKMD
ncbi:MAG: flagellar FlbD family protein [Planctomycetota bacterium]|jgi:flagellar protein FlbD|nr:flagellar FlbD family protein [Planctomycetota bacterium]